MRLRPPWTGDNMEYDRITFLEKRVRQLNWLTLAVAFALLLLATTTVFEGLALLDLKHYSGSLGLRLNRAEAQPVLSTQASQLQGPPN